MNNKAWVDLKGSGNLEEKKLQEAISFLGNTGTDAFREVVGPIRVQMLLK